MLLEENRFAAESDVIPYGGATDRAPSLPRPAERQSHETRTFDLPRSIWAVMFTAYAVFMIGITLATGHDGFTLFMIVISALYLLMFFGTAGLMNRIDAHGRPRAPSAKFETWTGPMDYKAVAAQMLAVPVLFAVFGIGIAIIRAVVM